MVPLVSSQGFQPLGDNSSPRSTSFGGCVFVVDHTPGHHQSKAESETQFGGFQWKTHPRQREEKESQQSYQNDPNRDATSKQHSRNSRHSRHPHPSHPSYFTSSLLPPRTSRGFGSCPITNQDPVQVHPVGLQEKRFRTPQTHTTHGELHEEGNRGFHGYPSFQGNMGRHSNQPSCQRSARRCHGLREHSTLTITTFGISTDDSIWGGVDTEASSDWWPKELRGPTRNIDAAHGRNKQAPH